MASVTLNHVYKVYPNGLKAVNDFSMDIHDKEFIVFVGPSGCGKSTTLRMIAGLEDITSGEIRIGGEVVNDVEPKDRDIAMVFQNYALYPHMTVYDNMAFGLQVRKLTKEEIDSRVREAARTLGLTDYLKKKPKEMSGGQRQRVALGRAMVREPKVFLLDEPLSNLDAKLRTQMRAEISKLHARIGTTFIYVTHDQTEAMTMGTRIVVMRDGFVQQIDTPRNLYSYPCNKFVAGFIGTPQMNFFSGTLKREGDKVEVRLKDTDVVLTADRKVFAKTDVTYLDGVKPVTLGIRSEHISTDPKKYPYTAECVVSYVEDLGIDSQVYADFAVGADESALNSETRVVIKAPAGTAYETGKVITVSLDLDNMHVFDEQTEVCVSPREPQRFLFGCKVTEGTLHLLGAEIALPPAIALPDGEYEVEVPAAAIKPGTAIKCAADGAEEINGYTLMRVTAADSIFFVRLDGTAPATESEPPAKPAKGKKIKKEKEAAAEFKTPPLCVDIDLKLCTFTKDGEVAVRPMPTENVLPCKIEKVKYVGEVIDRNGRKVSKKLKKCVLNGGDVVIDCTDEMTKRIINGAGKPVFKDELQMLFSPRIALTESGGIPLKAERVLDYGSERFAVCKVGESEVFIAVDGAFEGGTLRICPAPEDIRVFDLTIEIRLI